MNGIADKEKLGFRLLDMYGIGRAFENSLPPSQTAPFSTMPVWQRRPCRQPLCPSGGPCSEEFKARYKKELTAAGHARQHLISLLRGTQEAYANPSGVEEPSDYLLDPDKNILCRADRPGEPAG